MIHYERENHTKKEFEKQSVSHLSDNDSLNVSLSVKTPQSFSRKDSWALNLRYRFILIVILDSVNVLIVTSGSG